MTTGTTEARPHTTGRGGTTSIPALKHPGQVLSREQILAHAWGYDFDPASNVVDVYVRTLRRKIGADRLVTVRGAGYKLS